MEDPQESRYDIIITDPAEVGFYEILEYLYDHYPLDRAEEIANEIRDKANTLAYQAERGVPEPRLRRLEKDYRFILYNRTKRADIKIIYFINEGTVYITDFFPTEKDADDLAKRNR